MNNVRDVLSKFKDNLDGIITNYRVKVSDIEKEEDFNRVLSDFINYCESDVLLLPFYDETLLGRIFDRVFSDSLDEIKKVKTAKYLIDASKSVDTSNFPQYNDSVSKIKSIFKSIDSFYRDRVENSTFASDKENYNSIISSYSVIFDLIGIDGFNGLIEDIDLFERVINDCDLQSSDINEILSVAIVSNLGYLDRSGVVDVNDVSDNSLLESNINSLSNMLGEQVR